MNCPRSVSVTLALVYLLILGGIGCNTGPETFRLPTGGSPVPAPTPGAAVLIPFREPTTGFMTTDLRDAYDQILQLNSANELIWTADGTRLPGYRAAATYYIEGRICSQGCAFEVRFGSKSGERRAYLTVDYGHDNPGTMVDVEVTSAGLQVTQTPLFPPGSPTLTGVVTELTSTGRVPVVGASIYRIVRGGWQGTTTGVDGTYSLPGLINDTATVEARKDGYAVMRQGVVINGDTRFDFELTRQ